MLTGLSPWDNPRDVVRKVTMTLNTEALKKWVERTQPMAKEKLAATARISVKTANMILNHGYVPAQPGTRWRVSLATGIPEEELFKASKSKSA
jgi:hypothetical protein